MMYYNIHIVINLMIHHIKNYVSEALMTILIEYNNPIPLSGF